ncbi:hypothetical protein G4B88_014265 [Cannabis sativa]|uniref:RNase H type-1 domain-containing protein n=1 Tax=Cannabis sativa TaxID=3483 RepID=A0A7J6I9Y3_CANSA|nr:hypothetical protein G4B88_014265 [Cannabis sativa]
MYWRFCGFENENSKDEISSSWLWFRGCVCWTVRVLESEDGSERENFRGAYRQWGMTVGGGGQWLARLATGQHVNLANLLSFSPQTLKLSLKITAEHLLGLNSLGATIKNCHNQAIADFSIPKLGASTPLFAEAQALLEGLNCTNVRSKWKDKSALSILVELIRESLSYFPNASLQHIPRTDNREAHQNARDALQRDKDFTMRV